MKQPEIKEINLRKQEKNILPDWQTDSVFFYSVAMVIDFND